MNDNSLPLPPVFTWIPLPHLPHPPEHFIERAFSINYSSPETDLLAQINPGHNEYKHRDIVYQGQVHKSRCQEAQEMGPDWHQWVQENITAKYIATAARINATPPDDPGATVHGPHVDGRLVRLYYLLDRGGEDCVTEFYVEPNKPFNQEGFYLNNHYDNIDELIVIDRAKFPLRQWILINGCILHGLTGITGPRLNLVITIRPEDFTFDVRTTTLPNSQS
jgi:hypothetical protein